MFKELETYSNPGTVSGLSSLGQRVEGREEMQFSRGPRY